MEFAPIAYRRAPASFRILLRQSLISGRRGTLRQRMDQIASIAQQLLEFSPDALIVVDSRGSIRFANATTRALFGYTRDQLIGQPIEMLVPERFQLRHGAHISGFMRDPTNREMGARIADLFARRADGTEFPAGIRLAPFMDGDRAFVAAAIRDMTERRAINDALIAAREEADRANNAKTRFLATASHDLRQPLQTIRLLNASMLTMTQGAPSLHDLLQTQEQAINGASRLLNALLDITRLESGAVEPQLAPVSIDAIFADLAREFRPIAASKNLLLQFPNVQAVITTDRILLTQLLQNLIGNSLKYTAGGTVSIVLHTEAGALALDVEDTGVGIPDDKLDRIFDEYYQVDPKGTQRSGVGLGLAIVREVSRLLGYSVAVSSTLGRGTRVRVRIPLQRLSSVAAAPPHEVPLAEKHGALRRCRIILLEDNDSVRAATELFLGLEGYETRSAGTVAEAETLLADLQPDDLFISDYHLDDKLTGFDVLQSLRARHKRDVPAILLSGDLQSMMRIVRYEVPRCRFLSKPVDTNALLAAIEGLIA
jgi:two-component system, sensor histidine kinase